MTNNDVKYRAIWIPSGDYLIVGTVCVDRFGELYRFTHRSTGLVYENAITYYPFEGNAHNFQPVKLYLCDRNKHVGGRIFNTTTQECFECHSEFYIKGTNDLPDDWNVVAAIDPNTILEGFTPIEEDNIEGYMFGGGDDQLGYIVLKGIADKHYVKLP